jgi:hypothetical protein
MRLALVPPSNPTSEQLPLDEDMKAGISLFSTQKKKK